MLMRGSRAASAWIVLLEGCFPYAPPEAPVASPPQDAGPPAPSIPPEGLALKAALDALHSAPAPCPDEVTEALDDDTVDRFMKAFKAADCAAPGQELAWTVQCVTWAAEGFLVQADRLRAIEGTCCNDCAYEAVIGLEAMAARFEEQITARLEDAATRSSAEDLVTACSVAPSEVRANVESCPK